MWPSPNKVSLELSQEADMRRLILLSAAVALTFALAPFISSARTASSVAGEPLPSISVQDLTLASGSLTVLEYTDAH